MAGKKHRALYENGYIAKSVRNTKVDELLPRAFSPNSSASVDKYEDLGLLHFTSKAAMKRYFNNVKGDKLEQYWKDYLHRDELIARGQYDIVKGEVAEKNYIKRLEQIAGVAKSKSRELNNIIKNLKSLPSNKKIALYSKLTEGILPALSDIYELGNTLSSAEQLEELQRNTGIDIGNLDTAKTKAKESLGETELKFKKAFDIINENYNAYNIIDEDTGVVYNYSEFKNTLKHSKQVWSREFGKIATTKNYTNAISADEVAMKELVINEYKERAEQLLKRGRPLIYLTKSGREYIPFVKREVSDEIIAAIKEKYNEE